MCLIFADTHTHIPSAAALVIALWMCVSNRCGCRLRYKSNAYQWGVLKDSGRRVSQISSKRASNGWVAFCSGIAVADNECACVTV